MILSYNPVTSGIFFMAAMSFPNLGSKTLHLLPHYLRGHPKSLDTIMVRY